MKRILAFFLALVMIFAMVPALGTTAKADSGSTTTNTTTETVTAKPFYGLTWDKVERAFYGNLEDAPVLTVKNNNGILSMTGSDNFAEFLEVFPGFYAVLGSYTELPNTSGNHHNATFYVDDACLPMGVAFFLGCLEKLQ